MPKRNVLSRGLLVAFGGANLGGNLAFGQDVPVQELQRVMVTGTNIKRTDTETASPVQVLSRDDIERTGKQSIHEVLRVFDRKAPFDAYVVIPYLVNCNQAWHQAGAVARFSTVGAKYSF